MLDLSQYTLTLMHFNALRSLTQPCMIAYCATLSGSANQRIFESMYLGSNLPRGLTPYCVTLYDPVSPAGSSSSVMTKCCESTETIMRSVFYFHVGPAVRFVSRSSIVIGRC